MRASSLGLKVRALCLPDVNKPIGGVKQLYRHVEHLVKLGFEAAVVTQDPSFRPGWFESTAPSCSLHDAFSSGDLSSNNCILLVPETYLAVNWSDFWGLDLSAFSRVVFNQNAYYSFESFSAHPEPALRAFYGDPSLLHILSVSEDNHRFLSKCLGLEDHRLSRIVNAIEPSFRYGLEKHNRAHWMPRKNLDHARAVLLSLKRGGIRAAEGWQVLPLIDLTHCQVAHNLNHARLFLSFGHPEGFGLPVAEAMAAGCWVVGYSGGGGDELFKFGASSLVRFGDWTGFHSGIQYALDAFASRPRETEQLLMRQAEVIATLYSSDQEHRSIEMAWERIEEAFCAWLRTRH